MQKQETGRDLSIESLRGAGILLVVILHCVNARAGEVYHYFTFCFAYLTMPLFTAISGYVYALRPVQSRNLRQFLFSKLRRIGLPLVSVATAQYFLSAFLSGQSVSGWWHIYIFGYAQFWFLQSLLLVFLVVALLDALHVLDSFIVISLLIILTSLARIFIPALETDSIEGFIYILPYFLWGCSLRRFSWQLQNHFFVLIITVVALGGILLQHLTRAGFFEVRLDTNGPLATITGLALVFVVFRWRRSVPMLNFIGKYSYSIFLFHAFGISIVERAVLQFFHPEGYLLLFILKVMCGVLAGILAEKVLSRFGMLQYIFLGVHPKPVQKV